MIECEIRKFVNNIIIKLLVILITSNLISFKSFAQFNLIPNGSFENYTSCPGFGQIDSVSPWFQPNIGGSSSDVFNICNNPGYDGVPLNGTFQYPKTGNGYAGINFFHDTIIPMWDYDREYIEVMLTDSLRHGKKYCIRFYTVKGNWSMWAIKNIQAVLTIDSLLNNDINWSYITGVVPIMEADSIVTDTLNWLPVQKTFIANGGERFLTIGNFTPGDFVIYQQVLPYSNVPNTLGYYVIDDVSIYEQPDVFAGNDTLIQVGDSVQIGIPGRPDVFYNWHPTTGLNNPNIANPVANPIVSTLYILTVTDTNDLACTNDFIDTVRVWVGTIGVIENESNNNTGKIYPIPANNKLFFEPAKSGEKYTFEIFNTSGQILSKKEVIGNVEIDVSGLPNGLYFIKYISINETEIKKFTIINQGNP